ncbi:hypothetical protein RHMOL_Rhmol11G0186000 [Rhododendron molle]|uniref:Uncharacterized protein n=1 Tax=Rhododendron molle TaxID=49168 RepID=A0ACC0LTP8_RHOML|nr:hypothetical protein RHMOL_Rhmol11G0186000 [Rhododendron molle]
MWDKFWERRTFLFLVYSPVELRKHWAFVKHWFLLRTKVSLVFIVEGDSIQIVQTLTQVEKSFSDCSSILSDCLELIRLCLVNSLV